MIETILTLITALSISGVAAYYSIFGLAKIFAAATIPIIIMGSVLEVGKLVTASWLYRNWGTAPLLLKSYLTFACVMLMLITSMGIFGFLSSAHIEQTSIAEQNVAKIERIDDQIARHQSKIETSDASIDKIENTDRNNNEEINTQITTEESRILNIQNKYSELIDEQNTIIETSSKRLGLLDELISRDDVQGLQALIGTSVDGKYGEETARKVEEFRDREQKTVDANVGVARYTIASLRVKEGSEIQNVTDLISRLRTNIGVNTNEELDRTRIKALNDSIVDSELKIRVLTDEKFDLENEYRKIEAEVGPVKYIAEFVYGDNPDRQILDDAVRWVIFAIVLVFDPLAVLLIIAANINLAKLSAAKKEKEYIDTEPLSEEPLSAVEQILMKTEDGWVRKDKNDPVRERKSAANSRMEKRSKELNKHIIDKESDQSGV